MCTCVCVCVYKFSMSVPQSHSQKFWLRSCEMVHEYLYFVSFQVTLNAVINSNSNLQRDITGNWKSTLLKSAYWTGVSVCSRPLHSCHEPQVIHGPHPSITQLSALYSSDPPGPGHTPPSSGLPRRPDFLQYTLPCHHFLCDICYCFHSGSIVSLTFWWDLIYWALWYLHHYLKTKIVVRHFSCTWLSSA